MKIDKHPEIGGQMSRVGNHSWDVARLIQLSKDFKVINIPLDHLNVWYTYGKLTIREFAMHMNAVNDADLQYPIILDEDGTLMDGKHRITKAIVTGQKTIKAVRFDVNPSPCIVENSNE